MMRTEAPKDREGRGWVNLARTTPEFPGMQSQHARPGRKGLVVLGVVCTVGAGDLAPDDAELGSANLLLGLVDVGDLLAKVEAVSSVSSGSRVNSRLGDILGSVGVVNTLDLDQAGLGVRRVAVTLVGKVTTPVVPSLSVPMSSITFSIIPCPWRIVLRLELIVIA